VRWAVLAAALALLNVSLTFVNVWPTPGIRLTGAVSLELAAVIIAMVAARRWFGALSPRLLRGLSLLWVALVIGRYADVTARSLYGRDINLYWDLRYIPDVGAMLAFVARPWLVAATIAAAVLLPVLVYAPFRWALGCIDDATSDVGARRALAWAASGALLIVVAQVVDERIPAIPRFAEPVTAMYARQARQLAYEMSGAGVRRLAPAPPIASNLSNVAGADVFIIFIESYGVVAWDRPAFIDALASSRSRLDGVCARGINDVRR
jgi:hypothetical protein